MSDVHIYEGAPGTTATLLYTCPAAANVEVTTILAANTTGTAATITVERVPSGQAAGTGYAIVNAQSVAANANVNLLPADSEVVLNPGDMLYALQGTANAVNLEVDGTQTGGV